MSIGVALGIAVMALAIIVAAVVAVMAWSERRRSVQVLAQRLCTDNRLDELTEQTLAAMRGAARRAMNDAAGQSWRNLAD